MCEKLAAAVYNYPCLYDKKNKDFHVITIKTNAWDEIAKDLGLENGKIFFESTRKTGTYPHDSKYIYKFCICIFMGNQ